MKFLFNSLFLTGAAFASILGASAQCCNVYTSDGYAATTSDGVCVSLAYTTSDCANTVVRLPKDSDGDGVNDDMDMCPAVKGPAINNGCPQISTEIWSKFDAALGDVHFAVDSDSLTEGSHSALGMVASLMNANSDYTLKVSGYADSTGTDEHNIVLSEKRALRVKNYLISKGVPTNRILVAAYGEKMPVATNATTAGRSKNRRVEFDLLNNK